MGFLGTLLERPRNERAYVVIPVGHPAPDATVPAHALEKESLDQILVRVSPDNRAGADDLTGEAAS